MAVLSIGEIPGLKELIKPYGYTIHIHDACGGQSFTLEKTGDETDGAVFGVIEKFFRDHRMAVHYFGEDKLNFIAK